MFKTCLLNTKFNCLTLRSSRWNAKRFSSSISSKVPTLPAAILERARLLSSEHTTLSKQLADGFDSTIARKVGELSATTKALEAWETTQKSLLELQQLLRDSSTDNELRLLATEELEITLKSFNSLAYHLQESLVPRHPFASLPCLIEIRPGAGGIEAALFAGDLLRMYQNFCRRHAFRTNLLKLDVESAGFGADRQIQEAILEVDIPNAYDLLRCEAGVHRVQRIPATEKSGRTHTSAVAVLVLPSFQNENQEASQEASSDDPSSDYYIDPKDVRTDIMRARGAGGQHVNTTDSAVRLTHIPTGTVVAIQDLRSQPQNRQKAWQILRSKLAQARREAREEEIAQLRTSVIGVDRTGFRDKIRTYNWNQQRVTDHRSGITLHNLEDVLEGGDSLDKIMDSVKVWLREREVRSVIAEENAPSITKAIKK